MPGEPTLGDIHVDTPLTDYSLAYFQDESKYSVTQVFPSRQVQQQSNKYRVYDKAATLRTEAEKRAKNTEAPVRTYTMSTGSYYCEPWAIAIDVSEQDIANADAGVDLERTAVKTNVQDIRTRMEIEFGTAAFSTGIWATESTATWNTSTGDPVGDLATAVSTILQNTGFRANTLVLGADSWYSGLWNSTQIINRLADNQPRIVNPGFVRDLFNFERVIVLDSVRNSAVEDSTGDPTMAFVHGDHALVCYTDPSPGLESPTAGLTFLWTGYVGAGNGIRTMRLDMPWKDARPRVQTEAAFDFKVVATDLGYLIKDTVS